MVGRILEMCCTDIFPLFLSRFFSWSNNYTDGGEMNRRKWEPVELEVSAK